MKYEICEQCPRILRITEPAKSEFAMYVDAPGECLP
jgi:hypothetical protein